MWFSHLGKLEALQCPKTIEIIADPNYFILSKIKSVLWCPNKCRKLKLIAIFVFSNDSGRCSGEKEMPLIDYPFRHRESVRLLQPIFHPLFIYWQCTISATGKKTQTKQETRGKQREEKPSSVIAGIFVFAPHSSVTERRNKSQRSVVPKQNRAVPLGLWNNASDPIYSALSLGFILPLNAQMLWLFFGRNDCGHLLHIFSFWPIFTS